MTVASPKKAAKYFKAKMDFTTGPMELSKAIENHENMTIIDVRSLEDFGKSRIPGAINMPKGRWHNLGGLSKDKPNVIYCYSEVCHLAAEACKVFAEYGYPVVELEGGFEQWQQYGLPVDT